MKTKESAHMGQKIVSATSPDKSSDKTGLQEGFKGRSMADAGLNHTLNPMSYNDKVKKGNIPL